MYKHKTNKRIIDDMYNEGFLYSAYGAYERRVHGFKIFKVPLNAEFTCPNWDGRLSNSGCTFCPSFARQFTYNSFRQVIDKGFKEQIANQIKHYKQMGAGKKALVYIAFGTNTYEQIEVLKKIFDDAVSNRDVIGFTVGTRPDCLPDEVFDLLHSYVKTNKEVWLEIGQQTTHFATLKRTNRQHGLAELIRVVDEAHKRDIKVLVFMILGLPNESSAEIIESARILSALGVDAVKIYPLIVMKNTRLAQDYKNGKYKALGFDEYVNLVCDFLEHLSRYVLIQRLSKDCGLETKLAPKWNTYRLIVAPAVEKELKKRGTKQGSKFKLGLSVDELQPLKKQDKKEFYKQLKKQRSC
jgi:hypothetical protein